MYARKLVHIVLVCMVYVAWAQANASLFVRADSPSSSEGRASVTFPSLHAPHPHVSQTGNDSLPLPHESSEIRKCAAELEAGQEKTRQVIIAFQEDLRRLQTRHAERRARLAKFREEMASVRQQLEDLDKRKELSQPRPAPPTPVKVEVPPKKEPECVVKNSLLNKTMTMSEENITTLVENHGWEVSYSKPSSALFVAEVTCPQLELPFWLSQSKCQVELPQTLQSVPQALRSGFVPATDFERLLRNGTLRKVQESDGGVKVTCGFQTHFVVGDDSQGDDQEQVCTVRDHAFDETSYLRQDEVETLVVHHGWEVTYSKPSAAVFLAEVTCPSMEESFWISQWKCKVRLPQRLESAPEALRGGTIHATELENLLRNKTLKEVPGSDDACKVTCGARTIFVG